MAFSKAIKELLRKLLSSCKPIRAKTIKPKELLLSLSFQFHRRLFYFSSFQIALYDSTILLEGVSLLISFLHFDGLNLQSKERKSNM